MTIVCVCLHWGNYLLTGSEFFEIIVNNFIHKVEETQFSSYKSVGEVEAKDIGVIGLMERHKQLQRI